MWPNPQETVYLATFTEEILNGKLHFLCSDMWEYSHIFYAVNIMKVKKVVKLYSNNVVLLLQDNFNIEHHLTKKFVIDSKKILIWKTEKKDRAVRKICTCVDTWLIFNWNHEWQGPSMLVISVMSFETALFQSKKSRD